MKSKHYGKCKGRVTAITETSSQSQKGKFGGNKKNLRSIQSGKFFGGSRIFCPDRRMDCHREFSSKR